MFNVSYTENGKLIGGADGIVDGNDSDDDNDEVAEEEANMLV